MTDSPSALPRLNLGLAAVAADFDLILCDVWGVLHNGVRYNRTAVESLRRFRLGGGTVILVTNAPAPRAQVVNRLDSLGVPRDAFDDVATSGDVTVATIVAAGCPALFVIGPRIETALFAEAARLGPRAPDIVSIGEAELAICIGIDATGDLPEAYDPTLRRLRQRNLDFLCANPDIVVEMGDEMVYCAGAIAARYAAIGGTVIQAGKPHRPIYDRAIGLAAAIGVDIPRDRILAIGDALHTDLAGARDQGIASIFVTSGIHRAVLHTGPDPSAINTDALAHFLSDGDVRPMAAMPILRWA